MYIFLRMYVVFSSKEKIMGCFSSNNISQSFPYLLLQKNANRPYLYSRSWTGTSLRLRLMQGVFSNANDIFLFLMIFPA